MEINTYRHPSTHYFQIMIGQKTDVNLPELYLLLSMVKTFGLKSLASSLLISLGLVVLSYFVIRHSVGFLAVSAVIVGYDIWAYSPRYQIVTIGNGLLQFVSVNPLRKRKVTELSTINKVSLLCLNEVYYKIVLSTGDGEDTININMYPSEFKALSQNMKGAGLITETRSKDPRF
jgi:hypothetical protein